MGKTNNIKIINRAFFRFFVYGALLSFGEVAWYTVLRIGRKLPFFIKFIFSYNWLVDPRLDLENIWNVPIYTMFGQTSLWMVLVYGIVCLFGVERAYKKIKKWHWVYRGLIYTLIIMVMECFLGWILYWITGYSIWYYDDGGLTILKYTSLAITPLWFMLALLSENFMHIIDKLTRVKKENETLKKNTNK